MVVSSSSSTRFWAQVAAIVRPWRRILFLAVVCMIGAAIAGVVPPLVVRRVVNANLIPGRGGGLAASGFIYLGAVGAVAGFQFAYSYAAAIVAQRAIASLRVKIFSHLASVAVAYLDQTPLGEIIGRATADVETIDTLFTDGIATLVGQLVSLVAVVVAMLAISPTLSGISVLVIPPLAFVSRWIQKRVRDAERRTRSAIGTLLGALSETIGGSETIRVFGRESNFVERFRISLLGTLAAQEMSVRYNSFFSPVTSLLSASAIGVLLWFGSAGALGVNLGTLVAFVLLFQGFFAPLVALGDQWNSVQAAIAGAERVFDVLNLAPDMPPRDDGRADGRSCDTAGVVVAGLSFGYEPSRPVLHDVNIAASPGEKVAVVGRTGAGKSTLFALIGGLYSPDSGRISVAGRDPRGLTDRERRAILGVVPQNVQLFSGSLRYNITMGDEAIGDALVDRAIWLVGLEDLVKGLPGGLDTPLLGAGGACGVTLSAGERQLVALARALVIQPQVLLLDEATSAMDARSEAAFRSAMSRSAWTRSCAIVTVAHRMSTARDADRVIVLDGGRIVEEGPPDRLCKSDGFFASLVAIDAAGWEVSGISRRFADRTHEVP